MFRGLGLLTAVLMFFAPPAMAGFETKSYKAQSLLNALGYNVGSIDGFWGKNTKAALVTYLEKMGSTFEGELTEEHLVYLENSYTKKFGKFPLFGSAGTNLELLMPSKIPDTDNDWDALIKTELHTVDVSKAELKGIDWNTYKKVALRRPLIDPYAIGMTQGADCHALTYEFSTKYNTPEPSAWCNFILRTSLPVLGPEPLQSVLNHWANQPVEQFSPDDTDSTNIYIHQQNYAQITTTYALFYEQFDNNAAIDAWLSDWGVRFERTRPRGEAFCPFYDPFLMKRHKIKNLRHRNATGCGSMKWRGSIARIALGLRLKDQSLYLSGVRQLEALLGMFDKNGIFVPYATRGWDSLGYSIDVPNYLSDIALLLESVGFDFYEMHTTSGKTVGELIEITNAWLKNPQLAKDYYVGTKNERPGEQPKFFENVDDYGGYEQWRAERQSEDHDIFLRSFHYQVSKNPNVSDWIAEIKNKSAHVYGRDILPEMYFYGWTSAVPQVLTTLSQSQKIDNAFGFGKLNANISSARAEDYRVALLSEYEKLRQAVDFDLRQFLNPTIQHLIEVDWSEVIGLDPYFMENNASRGKHGFSGYIDRKEPLFMSVYDGNVYLKSSSYVADLQPGSKIGTITDDFIKLSFPGRICDACEEPRLIEATISRKLLAGASSSAAENGQRILFLPLP